MRIRTWLSLIVLAFGCECGVVAAPQDEFLLRPCRNFSNTNPPANREGRQTLLHVISLTYDVEDYAVDGPEWIKTECVAYSMTPGKPYSPGQFQPAFKRDLRELLHFSAHKEQKELEVFVFKLPVDGTLLKLKRADGHTTHGEMNFGSMHLPICKLPMFAQYLAHIIHRPVIDETGLSGEFDIDLRWGGADLQDAVKSQLGLELVLLKRPVERLVIDQIEKWPPN